MYEARLVYVDYYNLECLNEEIAFLLHPNKQLVTYNHFLSILQLNLQNKNLPLERVVWH